MKREDNKKSRPPWLVTLVVGMSMLVVMLGVVAFLYGREVIERPILAFFVLLAWVGALVGLNIPGSPGSQS